MQNESFLPAQESAAINPSVKVAASMEGPAEGSPGGAGWPPAGLLYLLLTTAQGNEKRFLKAVEKLLGGRTAIARKADTLRRNLQDLISRVGIDRIGFMTLTFKDNIRSREVAEKRFHSFETHILSALEVEYIAVPERQQRGAIHYHLAVAFPFDIRSGFDLAACSAANLVKKNGYLGDKNWLPECEERFHALERVYLASANPALRRVWRVIREANQRTEERNRKSQGRNVVPPFGRCETLPVLSNADAIAFYVGTYITSQSERRLPEDKGMRSVRYSLKIRNYLQSFQFVAGGNAKWRSGCKILSQLLLIHDEARAIPVGNKFVFEYPKDHVRSRFGPRWPHRLAPWIFACYDHPDECRVFGTTLSPNMSWRARLIAVGQFMDRLRGTGLSKTIPYVGVKAPDTSTLEAEIALLPTESKT